jgi:hypothetical protein
MIIITLDIGDKITMACLKIGNNKRRLKNLDNILVKYSIVVFIKLPHLQVILLLSEVSDCNHIKLICYRKTFLS